jgi:hypothetical protein
VILREAQQWFARAITVPESQPPAVSAETAAQELTPGPRLTPVERLEVYRTAYHARLIECLADDYPALQAALGERSFEALCRAYVARHPSASPSLNAFGAKMPAFCRAETGLECGPFAADLASLEWAIVEVIHAPGAPPLTPARLAEIPADAWAGAHLEPTPAFRLVRTHYPVNAFFQAFREGSNPAIPEPLPSATAVYRSGPTVWRMDLTVPMAALLERLVAGDALGDALDHAAAAMQGIPDEVAGQRLMSWFQAWVSGGLFTGASIEGAPTG